MPIMCGCWSFVSVLSCARDFMAWNRIKPRRCWKSPPAGIGWRCNYGRIVYPDGAGIWRGDDRGAILPLKRAFLLLRTNFPAGVLASDAAHVPASEMPPAE